MELIICFIYFSILLYASITDITKLIVKNRVHIFIMILAVFHYQLLLQNIAGAVLLTLPFLVLAVKTNQLGGGDVKFIFANTVFLGFTYSYVGIMVGLICIILLYYIKNKHLRVKRVAFIPYLSVGYVIISFLSLA